MGSGGEEPKWSQYQLMVLRLLEEHDDKLNLLPETNAKVESLSKHVENLDLIIRGGVDGHSILTRLESLENTVKSASSLEKEAKTDKYSRTAIVVSVVSLAVMLASVVIDVILRLI